GGPPAVAGAGGWLPRCGPICRLLCSPFRRECCWPVVRSHRSCFCPFLSPGHDNTSCMTFCSELVNAHHESRELRNSRQRSHESKWGLSDVELAWGHLAMHGQHPGTSTNSPS